MRKIVMGAILMTMVAVSVHAARTDTTDEVFRIGISPVAFSMDWLLFTEGLDAKDAKPVMNDLPSFGGEISLMFSLNGIVAVGMDAGFSWERHDNTSLQTIQDLSVYRFYPAFAFELHTPSMFFTGSWRNVRPETPSVRLEGTLLFGVSPAFTERSFSSVPFTGIKLSGVFSWYNIDIRVTPRVSAVWDFVSDTPYQTLLLNMGAVLSVGWRIE